MDRVKRFVKKLFSRKKQEGPALSEVLNELSAEYIVFSGIIHNNSEIGYVVFSRRQGLFIVNPGKDRGEVSYSGSHLIINKKPKSDAIKKALKDAFWLRATIREQIGIDVHITPIVAFENAKVKIDAPIIGVAVVESSAVLDIIIKAPEKMLLEDGVVMVLREKQGVHTMNYRGA